MNPNNLTDAQIKQGYSTLPGNFDPVTGQLKTAITSASLQPQPSPDLSQSFTPQPDLVTPTVAGAGANQSAFDIDYQRYLDLQNQGQDNTLANMIAGVDLQSLTGRGGAQADAESRLGVNQFNQSIADLSSQRGSKLAAYNQTIAQQRAEQANLEAGAGAKGLTTAMLGGQQAALARVREAENQTAAAEIGLLDAQILGTQGKLEAAQNAANRAVDLMYQDREASVNTKLKQIELYTPLFNANEKKKADALTFALNKENEKLAEEKENAKGIQNMIINASSQNAPQDLLTRAQKAKTSGEAAMILGQYAGDFYKTELLKQQIATEKAQRSKIYADMTATEQAAQAPEIAAWVANINSGKAKLSDVPAKLKNGVSIGLSTSTSLSPEVKAKVEASQAVYDLAQELKTLEGKGGAVGFGLKKTVFSKLPGIDETAIAGTDRANYEAKCRQVKDTLASANLDKLKGAMSDKDIEFLRNVGTALSLDMGQAAFDKELEKIAEIAARVPGVVKKETVNKFQQASGAQTTVIPGTAYVKDVGADGSINFELPKQ